jgi:hypothetical protein
MHCNLYRCIGSLVGLPGFRSLRNPEPAWIACRRFSEAKVPSSWNRNLTLTLPSQGLILRLEYTRLWVLSPSNVLFLVFEHVKNYN